MQHTASSTRASGSAALATTIDLTDGPRRAPVSREGQLTLLRRQLEWCDQAVVKAMRHTEQQMRRHDAEDDDRWVAVRQLRSLVWKVTQEILPLVSRVPPSLQQHPSYRDVQRVAHQLRRTTEAALRDNANHTIDLASGSPGPAFVIRG